MIKASIICDSVNPDKIRLTTFVLTYPRFIHSEFMTHRMISRNAASSRAIPIEKMIDSVENNCAAPEQWGRNQKGMQAVSTLDPTEQLKAEMHWSEAAKWATVGAAHLTVAGIHKQIANRVLEPFSHITVVATASAWVNFFALRAHPMAQPEFQVLAYRMLNEYLKIKPRTSEWGQWHLPFINGEDIAAACEADFNWVALALAKISAARCARVSYLTHEGIRSIDKDLELYDKLVGSKPLHASALEHPAQAIPNQVLPNSNFHPSWRQLRKTLVGENVTELNLAAVLKAKPDWISL